MLIFVCDAHGNTVKYLLHKPQEHISQIYEENGRS